MKKHYSKIDEVSPCFDNKGNIPVSLEFQVNYLSKLECCSFPDISKYRLRNLNTMSTLIVDEFDDCCLLDSNN